MKAVILAAGRGTRIDAVAHGRPKCLLGFGSKTILDFQIEGLLMGGVSDIAIIVGHNAETIVEHVRRKYSDCIDCIHFIHNREYARTNNICSLLLARTWVGGSGFLCLNADVLCHPDILADGVAAPGAVSMIVDPAWRDETMKVIVRNGRVIRMSKQIAREEYSGTYIGITKFSGKITKAVFSEIQTMVDEGRVQEFFNAAVQRLVDRGLHVGVTATRGLPWAEVDDPADLQFARFNVYPWLPLYWRPVRAPLPVVA